MPTERPNPREFEHPTEALDEPTGSIEFGPRRAAIHYPDAQQMGEDAKPASSSYLGGREDAAVRKAESRRARGPRESRWGRFWKSLRGLGE